MPFPSIDPKVNILVRYFLKAFNEVLLELQVLRGGIERQQAESLLVRIGSVLIDLDSNTKAWVESNVAEMFKMGQATVVKTVGAATSFIEAQNAVSTSRLARHTLDAMITDTYTDLLQATKNTERKVKQLVRNVVSESLRVKAIEQTGRRTVGNDIIRNLTKKGLSQKLQSDAWVGIVDTAGRRWNLSTYTDMVVRTKMTQAHIEGVRVEGMERHIDLVVISSHGAKDGCWEYEGLVISLNGQTEGFVTYDQIKASGVMFHPNCQHHVSIIRDFSLLPKVAKEKHEKAMQKISLNN